MLFQDTNFDIFMTITNWLSIEDIVTLTQVNKSFNVYSRSIKDLEYIKTIARYKIDYSDPCNYIYVSHEKDITDYFKSGNPMWKKIYDLYMLDYDLKDLNAMNMGVSSFPMYPNMVIFKGDNNILTSFEVQPKMIHFYGTNNQLISFTKIGRAHV